MKRNLFFKTSILLLALALTTGTSIFAQDDDNSLLSIQVDVIYLASDYLEGRATGTDGEAMAAEYIVSRFKDLGLSRVRLLTNNPKKTDAFIYGGFELEVVDQIPIMPPINEFNASYLATKRDKMGHQLPKDD